MWFKIWRARHNARILSKAAPSLNVIAQVGDVPVGTYHKGNRL